MPNCSIFGCTGNDNRSGAKKEPDLVQFKFPQNKALQDKWVEQINRKDFEVTPNSRVCEIHFSQEHFVPSLTSVRAGRVFNQTLRSSSLVRFNVGWRPVLWRTTTLSLTAAPPSARPAASPPPPTTRPFTPTSRSASSSSKASRQCQQVSSG